MKIEGGTGNGYAAKVTSENRLTVEAVTLTAEAHTNQMEGEAYHALFSEKANNASSLLFFTKNTSESDMVIEGLHVYSDAAGKLTIKLNDTGTPSGTTTVLPTNCNAGSGNVADILAYSGTSILGLSGGVEVLNLRTSAAGKTEYYNFEVDMIVPKNKTFSIYSGVSAITYEVAVVLYFHSDTSV